MSNVIHPYGSIFAAVSSTPGPMPGQTSRSSNNFSIDRALSAVFVRLWVTLPDGAIPDDIDNIRFNINHDKSGADEHVAENCCNQTVLQYDKISHHTDLYIAAVKGVNSSFSSFIVQFYTDAGPVKDCP